MSATLTNLGGKPAVDPWLRPAWPALLADAIGVFLVFDTAWTVGAGCPGMGFLLFDLPYVLPWPAAWLAVLGLGILLRWRLAVAAGIALGVCNSVQYFALRAGGRIGGLPVCLSLLVAAALVPALARRPLNNPLAVLGALVVLLLAHIFTFGWTDYRRPADAIVVFGAKALPDGTCSEALADRVMTGVAAWKQKLAPVLVMSGGDNEPAAMRALAMRNGVPAEAIALDDQGVNTQATLRNLSGRYRRVLAVSHYYHNARVKMAATRLGLDLVTVPAHMDQPLWHESFFVARECAAFVAYYFATR